MRTFIIIALFSVFSVSAYGQRQRPLNSGRIQQPTTQPNEQQLEERKKKMEKRREEYIANFMKTLEADDFQKQIIQQTLDSYFEKKLALYKVNYKHSVERDDAIKQLDETHFKELKELISESDMKRIKTLIAGEFDDAEVKKKEKKKKKKKRRNKDKN